MAVKKSLLDSIPDEDETPVKTSASPIKKAPAKILDEIPEEEEVTQAPVKRAIPLSSVVNGTNPDEDRSNLDHATKTLSDLVSDKPQNKGAIGSVVTGMAKSPGGITLSSGNADLLNSPNTIRISDHATENPELQLQKAKESAKKEVDASSAFISNFYDQYKSQLAGMLIFDKGSEAENSKSQRVITPGAISQSTASEEVQNPMQTLSQNMSNEGMFSKDNFINRLMNTSGDTKSLQNFNSYAMPMLAMEEKKELDDIYHMRREFIISDGKRGIGDDKELKKQEQEIKDKYGAAKTNLNQAVTALASLKTVNKKINELGASRISELDPLKIGMEVAKQTGYEQKVKTDQAKIQKGQELDPEDKVTYELQGNQAIQYAMYDQFAQGRDAIVKEISGKVNNYHEKVLADNPKYVKQKKVQALSAQIYKDENAFVSSVIDNDPTQEDIYKAAKKLGWSNEDIKGISPDDIQNPKVWYKRALGSFIENSAGGLYKLGMRGIASTVEASGGNVDWDAFNAHYDQNWYTNMGGLGLGGTHLMGNMPQGASLFGENTIINTDKNSPNYLGNEVNPQAGKFNWDIRAILSQVGEGIGQIEGQGYSGGQLAKVFQGVAKLRMGAEAASVLNEAQQVALAKRALSFGTTSSTFLTQYADNYSNAIDAIGNNPEDEGKRHLYASMLTASSALTEQILPDAKITGNFLMPNTAAGRELINTIRTEGVDGLKKNAKSIIVNGLKEGFVDWQKEISEDILDNIGGQLADAMLAPKKYEHTDYWEQQKQTYITSAISSAIPTMKHGVKNAINPSKLQKKLLFEIGSNPQTYIDDINNQVKQGILEQPDANASIQSVNTMSNIIDNHVPGISPVNGKKLTSSQKEDYAHNLFSETLLKANKAKNTDEVQGKHIDNTIQNLQAQRDDILKQAGQKPIKKEDLNININEGQLQDGNAQGNDIQQNNQESGNKIGSGQETTAKDQPQATVNEKGGTVDLKDPSTNPFGFEEQDFIPETSIDGKSNEQTQQESDSQSSVSKSIPVTGGEQGTVAATQPAANGGNSNISGEGGKKTTSEAQATEIKGFSPEEQQTISKNEILAKSLDFAQKVDEQGALAKDDASEKIKDFAVENGFWQGDLQEKLGDFDVKGGESYVWFNKENNKVIKAIADNHYNNLFQGLERIVYQNTLFPDNALNIIGYGHYGEDSKPRILVEQDIANGTPIRKNYRALYDHMTGLGFQPENNSKNTAAYTNDRFRVSDLSGENVMITPDNKLSFIDPVIRIKNKEANREQIVEEITGKNLTHVANTGMSAKEADGIYLSTKTGNRYATVTKSANNATVNISNPKVTSWNENAQLQIDIGKEMMNTQKFGKNDISIHSDKFHSIKNDMSNDQVSALLKDSFSPKEDLSEGGRKKVAKEITNRYIKEGFDSLYFPETKTQEGTLVVFNRDRVQLTPQINSNATQNSQGNSNSENGQSVTDNTQKNAKGERQVRIVHKSAPKKLGTRYQRAADVETNVPRQRVMQYFISGGQMDPSALKSFFKNSKEELNSRLWMQKTNGPTIDGLAHSLWEDHESKYGEGSATTSEYRDAIEEVMNGYTGKKSMVDELYDQHPDSIADQEMQEWAQSHQEEQEAYGQSFQDAVDILSQLSEEQIDQLIAEDKAGEEAFLQQILAEYKSSKEELSPEQKYQIRLNDAKRDLQSVQELLKQKENALIKLRGNDAKNADELQGSMFGGKQQNIFGTAGIADNTVLEKARTELNNARTEMHAAKENLKTVQDSNPLQTEIFEKIDNLEISPELNDSIQNLIDQDADLDRIVDAGVEMLKNGDSEHFIEKLTEALTNKSDEEKNTTTDRPAIATDQLGSINKGQSNEIVPKNADQENNGQSTETSESGGIGIASLDANMVEPKFTPIPKPEITGNEATDAVNEYNYRRHVLNAKEARAERAAERGQDLSDQDKQAMVVAKQKLGDALRKYKIKNPGLALSSPAQIGVALWNAAVETVALALDGGVLLRDAINQAVDFINKHHFTKWNETAFRDKMGENDIYERTPAEIRQLVLDNTVLSVANKKAADGLLEEIKKNNENVFSAQAHVNAIRGVSQATKNKINEYIKKAAEVEIYKAEGEQSANKHLADNNGDFGLAAQALTDEIEVALLASTNQYEKDNLRQKNAAARAYLNMQEIIQGVNDGTIHPNYGDQANGIQMPEQFGLPDRSAKDIAQEYGQDRYARLETAFKRSIVPIRPEIDALLSKRLEKSKSHYLLEQMWDYLGNKEKKKDSFYDRLQKAGLDIGRLGLYQYAMHAKERNDYNASRREKLTAEKLYELEVRLADPATTPAMTLSINAQINSIKNQQDPHFSTLPDGGSGMYNRQAEEILKTMTDEGVLDKYATFADEFRHNIIDKILDYKYDSSIIDEDTYNHLKSFYSNYVPLKVDMDEEEEGKKDRRMFKSTGLSGRDLYRSYGSVDKSFDQRNNPMLQSIVDLETAILKSERNKSNIKLANFIRENPNDKIWKIQNAQFETITDQAGNLFRVNEVNRPHYAEEFYEDGVKKYIVYFDKGLQNMAKKIGNQKIDNIISYPTRLLTSVNTLFSPEFILKNPLLDLGDAYLSTLGDKDKNVSKTFLKYAVQAPGVLAQMIYGKETNAWKTWVEAWKKNGGEISFLNQITMDDNATKSLKMFNNYGKKLSTADISNAVRSIRNISNSLEQMTRVMVYRSAVENGIPAEKAALISRNATVDFEKKGVYGTYINAFKAFANAGIQGGTNVAWLIKKSKRVRAFLGFMVLSGIAEGLLNDLAGGCDDDKKEGCWWEVEEFRKQKNFMIPLGPGHSPVSIPIGRQFAWFNYLGKNIYAAMRGKTTPSEFTVNTIASALDFYNPTGGSAPITQQMVGNLAPIMSLYENKNSFGSPVKPLKDNIPNHENYFPNTGKGYIEAADMISTITGGGQGREGKIDVSPNELKYIMQTAFGGIYNFVTNSAGLATNTINGEPTKNKNIPFVRIFSRESEMAVTKGKYYNAMDFSKSNLMTEKEMKDLTDYGDALVRAGVLSEDALDAQMRFVERNQSALERRYEKE